MEAHLRPARTAALFFLTESLMITKTLENPPTGKIKIFAIPDLSVHCTTWDNRLRETIAELRQANIAVDMHGSNASAERWCLNLEVNEAAKEILTKSQITFDLENHFPGLF